jgi:hypothetical protein
VSLRVAEGTRPLERRGAAAVQERAEEPEATEWDRFARAEYIRLALEEEAADDGGDGGEGWDGGDGGLLDGGAAAGAAGGAGGLEPLSSAGEAAALSQGPLSPSFLS